MSAIAIVIILLVLVVILALVGFSMYNGFVKDRNRIQESWRQVDVELNRRYELLPNLVETVRAYAAHERNTLEDVTRLRNQAAQISQSDGAGLPSAQRSEVEEQLSGAVRNLIVSVEAYPDLKSNQNFLALQSQLVETEDRIANGRRYYNANVAAYNTRVESVPSNIIAGLAHFEKATYFEVNDPAVRQAPSVSFGEIAYRGEGDQSGAFQQPPAPGQFSQPPQQQALPQQSPRTDDGLPGPQSSGYTPPSYTPQAQPGQSGPGYQAPGHAGPGSQDGRSGSGDGYQPPQTS